MNASDPGDDDAVLDGALEGFGERLQSSRAPPDTCTLAAPPNTGPATDAATRSAGAPSSSAAHSDPAPSRPGAARFDPLRKRGAGGKRQAQRAAAAPQGAAALDEAAFDNVAKDLAELMAGLASEPQAGGAAEQRQPFAETLRHLQDTTAAHAAAGGGGGGPPDAATSKLLEALTAAMGQQAGGEGGEGGMDAFVDSMMSQLLCKDVLYEPMKEIAMKFPPWLEAHRGELSEEQAAAYEVQIEHIEGVCGHLETHGDSQFDALLARLQKLQELGQPPEDLIKGLSASQGEGGAGLPPFLSDPSGGGAGGCPVQ